MSPDIVDTVLYCLLGRAVWLGSPLLSDKAHNQDRVMELRVWLGIRGVLKQEAYAKDELSTLTAPDIQSVC